MGIKDLHRDDTSGCDETGQEVSVCRRSVWAVTVVCATHDHSIIAMVLLKHLESGPQTTRVLINTSGAFRHVLAPL